MTKRNKWLMKHPTQAKYLLLVFLAMLAPTLVLGFCLYHVIFYLLAKQMAFPEAIASNLFPVIHQVNIILIFLLPALFLVLTVLGLMISHRFAGPIERLERSLDRLIQGDHYHKIQVRKNDDLAAVADKINRLMEILSKK